MIWKKLFVRLLNLLMNKIRKDARLMAKVYFNRLVLGTITYDAIPTKYQAQVKAYGIQWVKDGRMSVEEYEMLFKEEYPEE